MRHVRAEEVEDRQKFSEVGFINYSRPPKKWRFDLQQRQLAGKLGATKPRLGARGEKGLAQDIREKYTKAMGPE